MGHCAHPRSSERGAGRLPVAAGSDRPCQARVELWGIVLAAGEGTRLRSLVSRLTGELIPKQYVNFTGTRSMLEHTFQRAEKVIPRERLFTVVSQAHLGHRAARQQLSGRTPGTVVMQPENRDTGPGLLLPLMHIHRRRPDAVVAVFPSDHFILEEDLFMAHVGLACDAVERDPARLVLLGIEPDGPEPEYGYIVPGEKIDSPAGPALRGVAQFIEKPPTRMADELMRKGGLWNTLVMVFRVDAFLELTRAVAPMLARTFDRIGRAVGTPEEGKMVSSAYRDMRPLNLSRGILEILPHRIPALLRVLRVRGVRWSDWGSEERVLKALGAAGRVGLPREVPAGLPSTVGPARAGAVL